MGHGATLTTPTVTEAVEVPAPLEQLYVNVVVSVNGTDPVHPANGDVRLIGLGSRSAAPRSQRSGVPPVCEKTSLTCSSS